MAKKRARKPEHTFEHYYCTPGRWRRSYHFGLNPRRGRPGEESLDEWDHLVIDCTIRHAWRPSGSRRRVPELAEIWISPSSAPRSEWREDPKAVGAVWTDREKMIVSVRLASEVFHSLFPCLAANHFREVTFTVRDFHYHNGSLERISLEPEETPDEDL